MINKQQLVESVAKSLGINPEELVIEEIPFNEMNSSGFPNGYPEEFTDGLSKILAKKTMDERRMRRDREKNNTDKVAQASQRVSRTDDSYSKGINIVTDGADLIGETIKYCNIQHSNENDSINVIVTEEKSVLLSIVNPETNSAQSLTENDFLEVISQDIALQDELYGNNIITPRDVSSLSRKVERKEAQSNKDKQDRYEQFLKLKEEFEG